MKKLDIIILCGGLGKRIKNKSKGMLKILIEIRKKIPFIEYLLHSLDIKQFKSVILSIGFRRSKIIQYVRKNPNKNLRFNIEKKPLGTGGAIKNVISKKKITNPFFVINGDSFFSFNFKNLLYRKVLQSKKSYIILKKSEKEKRFDQFKILKNKLIMLKKNEKGSHLINSGLYLFYKKDFNIRKDQFSIENDIIPKLISSNKMNYIKNSSNIFFDIGVPKDLNKFKKYISKVKLKLN